LRSRSQRPRGAHATSLDTDHTRNARAPTSPRSTGFCVIWGCISSSSSSTWTRWSVATTTTDSRTKALAGRRGRCPHCWGPRECDDTPYEEEPCTAHRVAWHASCLDQPRGRPALPRHRKSRPGLKLCRVTIRRRKCNLGRSLSDCARTEDMPVGPGVARHLSRGRFSSPRGGPLRPRRCSGDRIQVDRNLRGHHRRPSLH